MSNVYNLSDIETKKIAEKMTEYVELKQQLQAIENESNKVRSKLFTVCAELRDSMDYRSYNKFLEDSINYYDLYISGHTGDDDSGGDNIA